jgi:hypothetical protein
MQKSILDLNKPHPNPSPGGEGQEKNTHMKSPLLSREKGKGDEAKEFEKTINEMKN